MEENFKLEELYLNNTIVKYDLIKDLLKKRIGLYMNMYKDNPFQLADLTYRAETKINLIKRTASKPYFARIDFKNEDGIIDNCYIGKVGLSDEDNNLVTVDWRAPIASMYYDSNIGNASYESPSGIVSGKLITKRQFNIEDGKLINYQDVDTVSNDEMLKPYLNASADNRLKNIVSTIQYEQNDIIREKLNKNIIVQGVAGSGKTTVALHRIAYLVYNNMNLIKPDEYMVIGPNKFFVNYISGVLPDLDVNNVVQLTYDEIVKDLVNEKYTLLSDEVKLKNISDGYDISFSKFKTSLEYKDLIDKFLEEYYLNIIPNEDLIINDYKILNKEYIKKVYNEINGYDTLNKKMNKVYQRLTKYIDINKPNILFNIREQYFNSENKDKKILNKVEKEINNKCMLSLRNYFALSRPKILNLYNEFLVKNNYETIKGKKIEYEDLPALLYLSYKICGNKEYDKFKHVVVDEAQDLNEFYYYVLKLLLPKATFSIFGDLAQGIYEYRGLSDWSLLNNVFDKLCDIKYLTKSYRTTTEIMNEANKILKYIGLNSAEPVIRHGKYVEYINYSNKLDSIYEILDSYILNEYKTIAIICKNEIESKEVYKYLLNKGVISHLITDGDTSYDGGICVITSYLAKGLEFDGVIISDASNDVYLENNNHDLKLLYVAMTRSLHELTILYNNKLVEALL